jgi:hypothetical protein
MPDQKKSSGSNNNPMPSTPIKKGGNLSQRSYGTGPKVPVKGGK